ncbi:cytochrome P450 [Mycena amicta]|nr:cytochrome P450 [Mycena amicta]
MPLSSYTYLALAIAIAAVILFVKRSSKLPLPPGPRGWPIIGNLLDMPSGFEWETYMRWSREYHSDVIHINIAGTSIVVLSSIEAARELLEKRGNLYSDRARLPMVNELMGWSFNFGFMKYGLRKCRRIFDHDFNADAVKKYHSKETAACHNLLRRLVDDPEDCNIVHHLRHMAGEVIMSAAYGITVLPENDPYVKLAEDAVRTMVYASLPGRFLVDSVPALMHLPAWFPGARFKRQAREWRSLSQAMIDTPFAEAKRQIATGSAPLSFIYNLLADLQDSKSDDDPDMEERIIKETAATMYTGGTDTTVAALATFVLAMLANPEAQRKAQQEIDSVIGNARLPDFTDDSEETLPYVSALVKEVFRWRPVAPLGVPHFVNVEDGYRGYRIPAQSIVLANVWLVKAMYPDPYEFKPERWLLEDGKLNPAIRTSDSVFGFGRRVCVGQHFARSSVWITIASILASLDISKAVDEAGGVVEPTHEYLSAMVIEPLPFKCSVKPRSEAARTLISDTANEDLVLE